MSYNVARRTREIGIRMALGARRSMVLRRILQETVTVSVAGILIGLAGALATTRLVAAFLFELSPRDPSTLLATAVVLMATTMAAGWLPARRAAAVDPMRALRNE
jgi:ABC-type antimicrobial peptide transport system permease subunit